MRTDTAATGTAAPPVSPTERGASSSEARIRAWLVGALAVLGPPLLLYLYYRALFVGLVNPDALDFAQLGRNLSEGRGFTAFVLRPLALSHGGNPMAQPDLVHGPLYPLILAIAFAAGGARDTVAAAVSGLFYLLTIPVVYLLGKRIFGQRVGWVTALIFTVNALVLEYATSGLHITLCILLMTLTLGVLYAIASHRANASAQTEADLPRGPLLLAGALAALLYLTEPLFVWVVPVLGAAVWAFAPSRKVRALLVFLVPFVILAGPWMLRNARLAGEPVFGLRGMELWMSTKNTYPGITAYRVMPADLAARPGLLQDVVRKVFVGAGTVLDTWPQIAANWVLAFFLPSLLFRFSDRAATHLRRYLLWSFGAVMLGMLLFQIQMPLFVAFVPAMLAFAVAYLLFLVQQAQLTRGGAATLAALLAVALVYPVALQLTMQDPPQMPVGKQTAQALSRAGQPTDVILTNQPWTTAWYARKPSVLLPLNDARITDIRRMFPSVRWLVLTQDVADWSPEWQIAFGALERWSAAFALASMQKQPRRPGQIMFRGPNPPLMGALSGFVSFPPLEPLGRARRNTVVALLPPPGAAKPAGR